MMDQLRQAARSYTTRQVHKITRGLPPPDPEVPWGTQLTLPFPLPARGREVLALDRQKPTRKEPKA